MARLIEARRFYGDVCVAVAVSLCAHNLHAQQPQKARVAVVAPLHTEVKELEDALGDLLTAALTDKKNLVIVERQKLALVLAEQKLALSGLVEPATAARVGKLLTADLVIAGSLVPAGEKWRYAIHVIAVDGQRLLGSAQGEGFKKDFDRLAWEMADKVAGLTGVKLPAIKPEDLDDSPVGRLHLLRGISFFYAGNFDQAIVYSLRAVRLDPRLQEARLWIAKAYLRQGEIAHARAELALLAGNPAAQGLAPEVQRLRAECDKKQH